MIAPDQGMKRSRSQISLNIVCLFGDIFDNVIAPFLCWWDLARMRRCSTHASKALFGALVHCFDATPDKLWSASFYPLFRHIELCSFKTILEVVLYTHAKELTIYDGFDEHIPTDMFPKTLESMRLSKSYWQNISPGMLPSNLKELYFDESFDEVIMPGVLPKGLRRLGFCCDLNVVAPCSFFAWSQFNQRIEPGLLPHGLEELELGTEYKQRLLPGSLPASLTSLKCWTRSLRSARRYKYTLFGDGTLPSNLKSLVLGDIRVLPGMLPTGLREIEFHCDFLSPLRSHDFPNSVTKLTLSGDFNQRISDVEFPPNLQELVLGDYFNQILLPGILPESLTYLHLGRDFDTELKVGSLPSKLETLIFGAIGCDRWHTFNQKLRRHVIPTSVRVLDLGLAFHFPLTRGVLPSGIHRLHLGAKYPYQQQLNRRSLGCPLVDITLYNKRQRTLPNSDPSMGRRYMYINEKRRQG